MNEQGDRTWDWIRRGSGLLFLAYIVFVNPPGLPSWVGLLIAGLLGLPDVIAGQIALNLRDRKRRNGFDEEIE